MEDITNPLQDLESQVVITFRDSLRELLDIWDHVGIIGEPRAERLEVVVSHIQNLLSEMVREEVELRERIINTVEDYTKQIQELSAQLKLNVPPEIPASDISLLAREKVLKRQFRQLVEQKEAQLKALNDLRKRESELCKILHIPSHEILNDIPSQSDLDELSQHIKMLLIEKAQREKEFFSLREEITDLMEKLETSPNTSFEQEILFSGNDEFVLSRENIATVKDVKINLERKFHQMEGWRTELLERLNVLWSILNIEESEKLLFSTKIKGSTPNAIRLLEEEVSKYEIMKTENLNKVIKKLKEDIIMWSDKCYMSQGDRVDFENSAFEDPSEELLNYYDSELQKVQQYYKENVEIFKKIAQREKLWVKLLEFERKASDPRRFNNRGGNLLREEKERKRLLKDIPKLEKELYTLTENWEAKEGRDFLVHGQKLQHFIEHQWEQHRADKENEKLKRQKQKALTTQEEMMLGVRFATPMKQKITPSRQYKCPRTARRPATAARSHTPDRTAQISVITPRSPPRLRARAATPLSTPRTRKRVLADSQMSNVRQSKSEKKFKTSSPAASIIDCQSSITGYNEFAKGLNKTARQNCRSTNVTPASNRSMRQLRMTPARGASGLPFLL